MIISVRKPEAEYQYEVLAALGSRAGDGRSVYLRLSGQDVRPMMTR